MRESTKQSPADRGEVMLAGRCQICGAEGPTIAVPGAPQPNQFCRPCAVEYGDQTAPDDEELEP